MRIYSTETNGKIGESVELAGWVDARRDHGKLIFIDLRDKEGIVQLVFSAKDEELRKKGDELRPEYVIRIRGVVAERPKDMVNTESTTGEVEIQVSELNILGRAETLPFDIKADGYEINEEIRMKYRYLDLRRKRMADNLKKRSETLRVIRAFLEDKGFTEIETPILSKSTPEGARDYLVPSRKQLGEFYALPQSPQQYKQLLMVAGLERYFQIARCFRDEDTRGDRQPEFTQVDIETSFASQEDILEMVEELFLDLIRRVYPEKKLKLEDGKIPRLAHKDVMEKYGTDRPDLRDDKSDGNELAPAFVVDFPMFETKNDGSIGAAHHPFTLPTYDTNIHPELLQHETDEQEKLNNMLSSKEDALKLYAYQYDIVLNGYEIGGGSIRNYYRDNIKRVFEVLGHDAGDFEEKFGHLYEAFGYGVPPHGGIALGFDRLSAILQNEQSIREVIAFPKTGDGRDLMMNAPSKVDKEQLDELGLEVKKRRK